MSEIYNRDGILSVITAFDISLISITQYSLLYYTYSGKIIKLNY